MDEARSELIQLSSGGYTDWVYVGSFACSEMSASIFGVTVKRARAFAVAQDRLEPRRSISQLRGAQTTLRWPFVVSLLVRAVGGNVTRRAGKTIEEHVKAEV